MPHAPSSQLFERVLSRIDCEERLGATRRRLVMAMVALILAAVTSVIAVRMAITELAASGFVAFSSLIIAYPDIVLAHWRTFVFVLLESLPSLSISIFLLAIWTVLRCLIRLARFVRIVTASA